MQGTAFAEIGGTGGALSSVVGTTGAVGVAAPGPGAVRAAVRGSMVRAMEERTWAGSISTAVPSSGVPHGARRRRRARTSTSTSGWPPTSSW